MRPVKAAWMPFMSGRLGNSNGQPQRGGLVSPDALIARPPLAACNLPVGAPLPAEPWCCTPSAIELGAQTVKIRGWRALWV